MVSKQVVRTQALSDKWNRLKVDLCSTAWLKSSRDEQVGVWKQFYNWASSDLFAKPTRVQSDMWQVIVMDAAKALDQVLRGLQINSDLEIEQRKVALAICTDMPALDLALMKSGIDLPKVTKLIWKGITKVLSCHHKSLGAEIQVTKFLMPLCARLSDGVKTMECALKGSSSGGRSVEASTGIISLALDYFYHIGIQLYTALGMPHTNLMSESVESICEALAKCRALVQTGTLSRKVGTTIERIFKSLASANPPLLRVHIGRNIFNQFCKDGHYILAVQSLQVVVGIKQPAALTLATSLLESLATHGCTGSASKDLWSEALTEQFAAILESLLSKEMSDGLADPPLLRALTRCLASPLPTVSIWSKRVCRSVPSVTGVLLRVTFLACCVLEEAELIQTSQRQTLVHEVEELGCCLQVLRINPEHFQQVCCFLPRNSTLQCLLKGTPPSKSQEYTIEDFAIARMLTHLNVTAGNPLRESMDFIIKSLKDLSQCSTSDRSKRVLERTSVCLIRSGHYFAAGNCSEFVRFLSSPFCRSSPKTICEVLHLCARRRSLLQSLGVPDLGLLLAEELRALQLHGCDELLLIRSCHVLQQIGGHPAAAQLQLNLLQSLFTTLFVHQLVGKNRVYQFMVFRTYERFIATNSTDLTSTFDFLETSTTKAFLKYLKQRKCSNTAAVNENVSVDLNGDEIVAARLEQVKKWCAELQDLKLPVLEPLKDFDSGLGEAKRLLLVLRDQLKTPGFDLERRQVVKDEAQQLTRMIQEINSILA